MSLFGRWPVANRATQVGGWPVFTWPNVPATGLTSQAHVDAPLIGSATLNAEISRLTYVSQLVESNKGAIFAARERLGTLGFVDSRQRKTWPPTRTSGFLNRTLSLRGLADHPIRVDPVRRTCPGASTSRCDQCPILAGRAGGSDCNSLSIASARSRSRRNSFMRARIIAKSSAARGWVIGSSRSLDLVLTTARSFYELLQGPTTTVRLGFDAAAVPSTSRHSGSCVELVSTRLLFL